MKRNRQEFYLHLKSVLWATIGAKDKIKGLKKQEEEIWFNALTKLRSLEHKLEKEYNKLTAKETEEFLKEKIKDE